MGADTPGLIHLNDNRAGRGSRQDRHEHLGDGRIGATGLGHLVRHPRLAQVPMLLETPGMDGRLGRRGHGACPGLRCAREPPVASRVAGASVVVPATRAARGARTHIPGSAPERA